MWPSNLLSDLAAVDFLLEHPFVQLGYSNRREEMSGEEKREMERRGEERRGEGRRREERNGKEGIG